MPEREAAVTCKDAPVLAIIKAILEGSALSRSFAANLPTYVRERAVEMDSHFESSASILRFFPSDQSTRLDVPSGKIAFSSDRK